MRLCLVRETRDRSILRKPWKRVLEGRDREKKNGIDSERIDGGKSRGMRVAVVGRKKWIMRRIENAGHDGNSAVLSRHPSRFLSPPRLCIRSVFSFLPCARGGRKKETQRVLVIYRACVRESYDVVFWWITYFAHFYRCTELVRESCIHSVADDERNTLPRWITCNPILERSINLDVDGFDGSFCVRILLRVKALYRLCIEKRYPDKTLTHLMDLLIFFINLFVILK